MNVPAKKAETAAATIEDVLMRGDLAGLTESQRLDYYKQVCNSLGLNPLTRPFDYLTLNGKLVLYARRDAADQLRKINGISVKIVSQRMHDGLLTVHVQATDKTGRTDEDLGVVPYKSGAAEIQANSVMKAVTKAKRRVTLSISGLGFMDETEIPSAAMPAPPSAAPTGEVISKAQETELRTLADQVDADERAYLDYLADRWEMALPSLSDIPAAYFDDAKKQLQRKAEQIDKAEATAPLGDAP